MAIRKHRRYRFIRTRSVTVVIDRLTRTWSVVQGGVLVDYGHTQRPDWTAYLSGRVKG